MTIFYYEFIFSHSLYIFKKHMRIHYDFCFCSKWFWKIGCTVWTYVPKNGRTFGKENYFFFEYLLQWKPIVIIFMTSELKQINYASLRNTFWAAKSLLMEAGMKYYGKSIIFFLLLLILYAFLLKYW